MNNILTAISPFFFGKYATLPERKHNPDSGKFKLHFRMYRQTLNVRELSDILQSAIAAEEKSAVTVMTADIRLYKMFRLEDNLFLGSLYAVNRNGLFYGTVIGSSNVFSCSENAFRLENSNEIYLPFNCAEEFKFATVFAWNKNSGDIQPVSFVKINQADGNETVLHAFSENTSYFDAILTGRKILFGF